MKQFIITSFLIATMVLALSGTAYASLVDIQDDPHREAIDKMVRLGVLEGRGDGRFWPEDHLTRAEAAKVAAYLSGFDAEDADEARSESSAFDDVYIGMTAHEWAVGWINLAAGEGLVAGHGDGTYRPGDKLQMVQWAAILVRILDHEIEDMSWPDCYDQLVHDLGLTSDLPYKSATYVNRGEMARFTANAVYHVKRPDGSRILDLLQERMEDVDEEPEPGPVDPPTEFAVFTEVNPEFIPGGGGQRVSIMVTVTDGQRHPVPGASVLFFKEALGRTVAVTMADDEGHYTSTVSTGEYHVNIEFPDGSRHGLHEEISEAGATSIIDYDKGVVKGIALNWTTGDEIIAIPNFPGGVSDHTCIAVPDDDGSFMLFLQPGDWDLVILGRPEYSGRSVTVTSGEVTDVGTVDLRE